MQQPKNGIIYLQKNKTSRLCKFISSIDWMFWYVCAHSPSQVWTERRAINASPRKKLSLEKPPRKTASLWVAVSISQLKKLFIYFIHKVKNNDCKWTITAKRSWLHRKVLWRLSRTMFLAVFTLITKTVRKSIIETQSRLNTEQKRFRV